MTKEPTTVSVKAYRPGIYKATDDEIDTFMNVLPDAEGMSDIASILIECCKSVETKEMTFGEYQEYMAGMKY